MYDKSMGDWIRRRIQADLVSSLNLNSDASEVKWEENRRLGLDSRKNKERLIVNSPIDKQQIQTLSSKNAFIAKQLLM